MCAINCREQMQKCACPDAGPTKLGMQERCRGLRPRQKTDKRCTIGLFPFELDRNPYIGDRFFPINFIAACIGPTLCSCGRGGAKD